MPCFCTGSRGARFEQTFRFFVAIDRARKTTDICCVTRVTHHMYRRTNNCGLLNSTRSTFTNFYSALRASFGKRNPMVAWGERIVARMKQDRITRHQVTYMLNVCDFALTRSICTVKNDRICSLI